MSATELLINLLGAAALLLWGIRMVRTGVTRGYSIELQRLLNGAMRRRVTAFLAGMSVTIGLQSSTATALIITSFAGHRLIGTSPALAVMLGADLGTTIVAQILTFDLSWLSPLLIFCGVVTWLIRPPRRIRQLGRIAIGLGLMLLALRLLVLTSNPMRQSETLRVVFDALQDDILIGLLIGALLTWLAHSSLAIVLLITSLAASGVVSPPLAVALVLGANVGGALPAVIATLADGATARRVSIGNLVFRTVGALAVLPFIDLLVPHLAAISGEPARMVVNFHMAFNLGLGLVFLPLTSQAGAALDRLLPDREDTDDPKKPRHLDDDALDTPSLALAGASREALRMGDIVESMLADTFDALRDGNRPLLVDISQREDVVDHLYRAIKLFVTKATRQRLSDRESQRSAEILAFTTNLEHIGDIIDTSLLEMVDKRIQRDVDFSSEGWREIDELHRHVLGDLRVALGIFLSGEVDEARRLIEEKQTVREIERKAADNHMTRLRDGRVESIETSTLHLDVLRDLKRIHSHICAIAYPILDGAGQLRRSRLKRLPGNKAKNKTDTGTPS